MWRVRQDVSSVLTDLDHAWQFWTACRSGRLYIRFMTKNFALVALLAFFPHEGHCLEPAKDLAFEVASITPCKPGTPPEPGEGHGMPHLTSPGGRFTARAKTVVFLLEWAYDLQPAQHSSGPAWLSADRYDIVAKAPGDATDAEMKLMVQSLLADRFHLQWHREQKTMSALVVSTGKSAPKLAPSKPGEAEALRMDPQKGAGDK